MSEIANYFLYRNAEGETGLSANSIDDLELADMLEDEYELYYFCESVREGVLSFDYKLKCGVATEYNAIKILEICDYPASLVSEAHSITSI